MKDYKERCSNCAYLISYNGEWVCECFGKRCKDIEFCENVEGTEDDIDDHDETIVID